MAKTGTFLKQLGTLGFSSLLYPRKQHPDAIVSYTLTKKVIGLIFCTLTLKYIDFDRWEFQLHCINTFYRIIWKVKECFFGTPCIFSIWRYFQPLTSLLVAPTYQADGFIQLKLDKLADFQSNFDTSYVSDGFIPYGDTNTPACGGQLQHITDGQSTKKIQYLVRLSFFFSYLIEK